MVKPSGIKLKTYRIFTVLRTAESAAEAKL